jgi:preprotein translocase SecE subunit
MPPKYSFVKNLFEDFHTITWPTAKEIKEYTIMVIILSLLLATYIGAFDYLLTELFRWVQNISL